VLTPQPTSVQAPVPVPGNQLPPAPAPGPSELPTPAPAPEPIELPTPTPAPEPIEKQTPVPAVVPKPEIAKAPIESNPHSHAQEPATPLPPRRSQRSRRPPKYFHDEFHLAHALPSASHFDYLFSAIHCASINVVQKSVPDTLTFHQAMKDKDRDKWIQAAETEIKELENHHVWEEVPADQVKAKNIPATWVFRRKRNPAGDIKRWKARICLRGDLIEGSGTYSPVVAFSTVRLFLIVSMILDWPTCSIDLQTRSFKRLIPTRLT